MKLFSETALVSSLGKIRLNTPPHALTSGSETTTTGTEAKKPGNMKPNVPNITDCNVKPKIPKDVRKTMRRTRVGTLPMRNQPRKRDGAIAESMFGPSMLTFGRRVSRSEATPSPNNKPTPSKSARRNITRSATLKGRFCSAVRNSSTVRFP